MPAPTTKHHEIDLIGHDCMTYSEIINQSQKSPNVIERRRICRLCSRIWTTKETCKGFLTESTDETRAKILNIVDSVCNIFEIKENDLLGTNRKRDLSLARQIAMYVAKESGYSFPKIGNIFNRHHTTVIHGCRHVELKIKKDARLRGLIEVLIYKDKETERER